MTTLVSRAEWGAKPRRTGTTSIIEHPSVTFHYVGGGWEFPWDHSSCDDKVRAIQADHMAPKSDGGRGWSDIAYNYLPCPHDYVYEGRGYDRRSSANGYEEANNASFAVCGLWGTASADDPLPDGLKRAFLFARKILIDKGGATTVVKGHRDWKETDCPGNQIYAWIQHGFPAPLEPNKPEEDDMFDDKARGRLDYVYNEFIDSDGSPGVQTLVKRAMQDIGEVQQDLSSLASLATASRTDVANLREQVSAMDSKLAAILQKLNSPTS